MATRFYDEAILEKIQNWVKDPNMKVMGPRDTAALFRQQADIVHDKPLKLPLITLIRDSNLDILNTSKKPLTFDGIMLDSDGEHTIQLNGIPIRLAYSIDIYTRYEDEADEYIRNFVFNIINHPQFSITIPYNDANIIYHGNMVLLSPVRENSNTSLKLASDQFARWTIDFEVNDAYLFSVPIVNNVKMSTEIDVDHDLKHLSSTLINIKEGD